MRKNGADSSKAAPVQAFMLHNADYVICVDCIFKMCLYTAKECRLERNSGWEMMEYTDLSGKTLETTEDNKEKGVYV